MVNVKFGRINTTGQTQVKTFTSDYAAIAYVERIIREKTGKGYVEKPYKVSSAAAVAPLAIPVKLATLASAAASLGKPVTHEVHRRRVSKIRRKGDDEEE